MRSLLLIISLFIASWASGQTFAIMSNTKKKASAPSPTRMYFSANTTTPIISPAFDAGWEVTTTTPRRIMSETKDGSTIASRTTDATGAASVRDVCNIQFVSDLPLAAQTISGTIKMQMRGNISSTASSSAGKMTVSIRVVNATADTVRGTLYSSLGTGVGTDFTTTLTNRQIASASLSSVTPHEGDYLVIEVGWTYTTGTNTTRTATQSFGSSSGSDLAEDESSTAADNPWIEFSNGVTWTTPYPAIALATSDGNSYDHTSQSTFSVGLAVRSGWMGVVDYNSGGVVFDYTRTANANISTSTYAHTKSLSAASYLFDMTLLPDSSGFISCVFDSTVIKQWNMTGMDISTAAYQTRLDVSGGCHNAAGVAYMSDGYGILVFDNIGASLKQYRGTSQWDITGFTTHATADSLSISNLGGTGQGVASGDGVNLVIVGPMVYFADKANNYVYQIRLNDPTNITAGYSYMGRLDVTNNSWGIDIYNGKFYTLSGALIYQYTIPNR